MYDIFLDTMSVSKEESAILVFEEKMKREIEKQCSADLEEEVVVDNISFVFDNKKILDALSARGKSIFGNNDKKLAAAS